MSKCQVILISFCACAAPLGACDKAATSRLNADKAPTAPAEIVRPKLSPGSAVCRLDPLAPGPMRRGGVARVRLAGDGLNIDARDVPALCGPLFNATVNALNVKAGDGVLFETCLPEGTLQISSWGRTPGKQSVHGGDEQAGTEVLFNQNRGATYTTRGTATDTLVLSDDFWKAEADVVLYSVSGNGGVQAKVSFDCPPPGPWEDAPNAKPK